MVLGHFKLAEVDNKGSKEDNKGNTIKLLLQKSQEILEHNTGIFIGIWEE